MREMEKAVLRCSTGEEDGNKEEEKGWVKEGREKASTLKVRQIGE